MSETPTTDVVKWYTRARKFPQLIGRTPDGMKLWGGPYTITQACGFGAVLFMGLNTMSLWARFGFLGNFVVLGSVAVAVVFGLGRIPVGSRSPLSVGAGAWKAVGSPQHGRLGGRPVRLRRPHRLQHKVVMQVAPLPSPQRTASLAPDPAVPATASATRTSLLSPAVRQRLTRRPRRPAPAPLAPTAPAAARRPSHQDEPAPALTGIQALLATSATTHRSETSR